MEIGDYARTKDGVILKIKDIEDIYTIDNEYIGMAIYDKEGHFVNEVEIIKSSPNIIDLIEVGDYVNGSYIQEIKEIKNNEMTCMLDSDYESYSHIKNEDIKSILTHEQFSQTEYKVGE